MEARESAVQLVHDTPFLSLPDRIRRFVQSLPVLPKHLVPLEDSCPICLLPFQTILEELPSASGGEQGQGEDEGEEMGITKVGGCGHVFCRRDLAQWIRSQHGNCPACRSQFVPSDILAPLRDDDESSDGGEYIPPSEADDDYDYTFSEMEFEDPDDDWGVDFDSEPVALQDPEDVEYAYGDVDMWEVDYDDDGAGEEQAQEYVWSARDHHDFDVLTVEVEEPEQDEDGALEGEWGLTDGESNRSTSSAFSADLGLRNDEERGAAARVQTSASRSEGEIEGSLIAPPDDTAPK